MKFTWKYIRSLDEVDSVDRHGYDVTGNEETAYYICLIDGHPNQVTGELGGCFYSGDPKDALEMLGYYNPHKRSVAKIKEQRDRELSQKSIQAVKEMMLVLNK